MSKNAVCPCCDTRTHISKREHDVLCQIARGLTNKEIASELRLSEKTIKNHMSRLFCSLHVQSRTAALIVGIQAGLVAIDPATTQQTCRPR